MKIHIRESDAIARVQAQWRAERPELDTRPLETIGRILRIQFLAGARIRRLLQRHGLDGGGFDVLATLRRSGSPHRMTPTALYRELILTSGAMTNRIDVLERAGLVKRHPDPADRRGTLIELTREGLALVDRAMEEHMAGEAAMAAHLTKEEQKELAGLLQKLLAGMEDDRDSE